MLLKKSDLIAVVEKTLLAANNNSNAEIHHCIRLQKKGALLLAEGASPALTITAKEEVDDTTEELDIVVWAKIFRDIIVKCKDDISLEIPKKGVLQIKSGSMSFTTEYKDPSLWTVRPPFQEKETFQLEDDFFKETAHCLDKRDNGKMNCYCLELAESGYQVTALDGHRIAFRSGITSANESKERLVLQSSLVSLAMKLCGSVMDVALDGERIKFSASETGVVVEGTLFCDEYYNTEKIFAAARDNSETTITLKKDDLLEALSVTNMLSDVTILESTDKVLKVSNKKAVIGNTENVLDADIKGKAIRMGVNGKFLEEAVRSLHEEEVTLKINGSKSPVLMEEEGTVELVLPVAISA